MLFFRLVLLASAAAYLFLAILFIVKKNRLSLLFSLACLSILVYTVGYAFELGSSGIDEVRFWLQVEYFGLAFVPGLWFIFAFNINMRKEPDPLLTWAVLLPAVLTVAVTSTNEFHHLYYRDISFLAVDGALVAQLSKGPLYYCFIVYSTALILLTHWFFFRQWRKSGLGFRSGTFRLFIASLSVLGFQGVYLFGLSPYNIDLTSLGFLFASIAASFAVFENDFLKADELVKSVVFSGIREGILVVDSKDRISDYNSASGRLFPWLNPDSLGRSLDSSEQGAALAEAAKAGKTLVVRSDAKKRYYNAVVQGLVEGSRVLGKVYVVNDVTSMRRVFRRLYRLANFDTLTKVFNRHRFFDDMGKEISRLNRYGGRLSLIMLDLDRFKELNDQHGHLAGDKVLAAVGALLKTRVRSSDLVGRYGGEEFCILLIEADLEKARLVAEDLRSSMERLEVDISGRKVGVTGSFGIVSVEGGKGKVEMEHLLSEADRALYRAKAGGRNRVES